MSFFFFNDTATTEIYTLSLHDALPISRSASPSRRRRRRARGDPACASRSRRPALRGARRSEEHTSELQSQSNLVCRLLLEKNAVEVVDMHVVIAARQIGYSLAFPK